MGTSVQCPRHDWRRCTLDGFVEADGAVWEAKHSNGFAGTDELLERYMPQLQHNMAVTGAQRAWLLVLISNYRFEAIEVAADWLYQLELLEAEAEFWECVTTGREPVPAPTPAPPRPIGVREVYLEGNNAWAAAAADLLGNRDAAKTHATAAKTIKELIEADVARAFGHGIEAKRSRAGAISRMLAREALGCGKSGQPVTVRVAFVLVSALDGSRHTIESFGEAIDESDKGSAKAMSAAYKSSMLQAFCIPVPQEDADARSPILGRPGSSQTVKQVPLPTAQPQARLHFPSRSRAGRPGPAK